MTSTATDTTPVLGPIGGPGSAYPGHPHLAILTREQNASVGGELITPGTVVMWLNGRTDDDMQTWAVVGVGGMAFCAPRSAVRVLGRGTRVVAAEHADGFSVILADSATHPRGRDGVRATYDALVPAVDLMPAVVSLAWSVVGDSTPIDVIDGPAAEPEDDDVCGCGHPDCGTC